MDTSHSLGGKPRTGAKGDEADADAEDELRHLARHKEDWETDEGELAAALKDLERHGE